jgi:hypothetical protein
MGYYYRNVQDLTLWSAQRHGSAVATHSGVAHLHISQDQHQQLTSPQQQKDYDYKPTGV